MVVTEFLTQVNYAYRGTDDDAPQPTDDDGKQWLAMYNRKKHRMYADKTKNWESAYDDKVVGTIVTGANIVSLDSANVNGDLSNFITAARKVYVIDSAGQYHYYSVVKVTEIDQRKQQVYFYSRNPVKMAFTKAVLTGDAIIGGAIHVPGYWEPANIDPSAAGVENQIIAIDDPYWAVIDVAATLAQNDTTYEDKFPDLKAESNDLWKTMVKSNRRRPHGETQRSKTVAYRIRSPR